MGRGQRQDTAASYGRWDRRPKPSPELRVLLEADYEDHYFPEDGVISTFANPIVEITPGVIDGAAKMWYRHGHCALLAIEMHRATGWPLVMLATEQPREHADTRMVHVLVRRPDGKLLDIAGPTTDERALAYWANKHPDLEVLEFTEEAQLLPHSGDDFSIYTEIERQMTRDFAQQLLAES